jgi:iron complex outermembrane receptor protein
MPDPSGTRFDALRSTTKRRFGLAVLLIAGGTLSLGVQAQTASGTNQAAVQAGLQAAVQDGVQTIQSAQAQAQAAYTHKTTPSQTATAKPVQAKRIGAFDENTLVAQADQPAPADQSANSTAPEEQLQEVVVTGSMIARPTSETVEAVTTISADDLKSEGITNAEQALSRISANETGNSYTTASSVSTFEGGATYANLRGIGSGQTLVLLDGQRLATNVVTGDGIDLSTIPFAAIADIEVLREGAAALYGTDAIGGVINFITKKNYQKGELDVTGTKPQDGGGGGTDASLTFGHGDIASDGYNFLVAADFNYGAELRASQRSFADSGFFPDQNLLSTNNPGTIPGSYMDNNKNQYQVGWPGCAGNPALTRYYTGECSYEYSAQVDLIPRNTKASGLAELTKALPGNNQVALQYFYARSTVADWGGPEEYAGRTSPASPYYPTAAESTCATSVSDCTPGGPALGGNLETIWTDPFNSRTNEYVNAEQRILLTFSGSNAGWTYSSNLDFSLNHNDSYLYGYPNLGIIQPGNVFNPLINPFGPQSPAGEAVIQQSYGYDGLVAVGTYRMWSLNGQASHDLGDALASGRPAAVAVGFNVEGEHVGYTTTPLAVYTDSGSGFFPTATQGARTEQAVYTEVNVPMTKQFEATISDRQDRYSDFGNTNNAKLQLRYQPTQMLTFRGTASTGFQAPTLFQLFRPETFGATGQMSSYPGCATGQYTAVFTASNCQAQGLALFGGNTQLKPQTSENFDVGVIVEPIQNLGVTLDWYRIIIANAISTVPSTAIYASPATFPGYYVLNNGGSLTNSPNLSVDCTPYTAPTCGYILQNATNSGGLQTDGLDLSARYTQQTAFGKFNISLEGTLITRFLVQQYTNGPELNLDGEWNKGEEPVMRWTHDLNVDWSNGNWGAGLNNHFLSSYNDYGLYADGSVHTVANYSLWGIYGSYRPIDPLMVTLGISNLLDTNPPFSNQGDGTNTNWQSGYNPLYSDPTGRAFYLRLKYQFL